MPTQTVSAHYGIGNQRVATVDTGHKRAGENTESQQIITGEKSQQEGDKEC